MEEVWKPIKGYEGLYEVSSLGRVKSLNFKRSGEEGILSPASKPYLQVTLYSKGKASQPLVHRLVAETFIPNPNNLPQINHIDEDTHNNSVENLEWCSSSYNINYGKRNSTVSRKAVERARRVIKQDIWGDLQLFESLGEVTRFGYDRSHVHSCCTGKRKSHRGCTWFYEEEYNEIHGI